MTPPSWSSVILPSSRFRAESVIGPSIVAASCGTRPLERCGVELSSSAQSGVRETVFEHLPPDPMSITEHTWRFDASSILLRLRHASSRAEKSRSGVQGRGIHRSVPAGNEKTVENGKIAGARGTVVGRCNRSPPLFADTGAPCDCVPPPAQGPSDNPARPHPLSFARPLRLWPGNVYYLPGLRAKIRIRPQGQTTGRLLGHP